MIRPRELDATGEQLTVFAHVSLNGNDAKAVSSFSRAMRRLPQVVECHQMAEDGRFLLRIMVADLQDYREFQLKHLIRVHGVESIKSDISLQGIKVATRTRLTRTPR